MRTIRWAAIAVGAALVVLAIVAGLGSRTSTLRELVVERLAERVDSEIELRAFSVDTFPTVDIRGEGLVVRHRGRQDVPPLIKIESFTVQGGLMGLLARPRRFRSITLQGLEINVPAGGADVGGGTDGAPAAGGASDSPFHIEELESRDAVLRLIPRSSDKPPREFALHTLRMTGIGVDARMPFEAELTNPVPRGQIKTEGRFGPWAAGSPGQTPLDGRYSFENADLGTINGIGGILSSTGHFHGHLGRIDVKGTTETPDFRLEHGVNSLPLSTTFHAIVDGTDGDTYLEAVHATLDRTRIFASGAVVGQRGVKGRTVKLHVKVDEGRIEDFLRLAVRSKTPLLTGDVALHTDFLLPPGPRPVVDRLKLTGEFDLDSARFSDRNVGEKLAGMSARARGQDPEEAPDAVVSDLEGRFRLSDATISFAQLRFQVPGATVRLSGTYGLQSESLHFDGTLRMQATVSEAAGDGIKSVLLKIVDPLFRKKGAGALLPIRVRGTRDEPKFGLDVMQALTPK